MKSDIDGLAVAEHDHPRRLLGEMLADDELVARPRE